MNEALCRALLQARLTEEDAAVSLHVDPKTVRRWMEGRVPYLRHRWAMALLVDMGEADLWPQLATARSRPREVAAVYPRSDWVPPQAWLRLLTSATREAGVLAGIDSALMDDAAIIGVLAERASSGVRVRVCLADHAEPQISKRGTAGAAGNMPVPVLRGALGVAQLRLHRVANYNSICYADNQLLAVQYVYGLPVGEAPVLHLRGNADEEMLAAYLGSFERIWDAARPFD